MTEDEIVEAMARAVWNFRHPLDPWDSEHFTGPSDMERDRALAEASVSLSIAIPWAREQALREAANVAKHHLTLDRRKAWTEGFGSTFHPVDASALTSTQIATDVLALIPSRPSQETT